MERQGSTHSKQALGSFTKHARALARAARRGARFLNPVGLIKRSIAREQLGDAVNRNWPEVARAACFTLGEDAAAAGHGDGTPWIILASGRGHEECLSILLDVGADPNATERDGTPAVAVAAQHGHAGCVDLLLKAGANPLAKGFHGKSPLWLMAEVDSRRATMGRENYPLCARLLSLAGADVDEVGPGGLTPIMLAAQQGRADLALELVSLGAAFTLTTPQGIEISAFEVAALAGQKDCALALFAVHQARVQKKALEQFTAPALARAGASKRL